MQVLFLFVVMLGYLPVNSFDLLELCLLVFQLLLQFLLAQAQMFHSLFQFSLLGCFLLQLLLKPLLSLCCLLLQPSDLIITLLQGLQSSD